MIRFALVLMVLAPVFTSHAALRPADIFQENMVLQRELPVPVWGWADAGAKVEVAFAGQTQSAQADAKGYWKVVLQPLEAGNEGRELVMRSGSDQVTLKNILVGEVWLVAGQSNMRAGGPDTDTGIYPHYQSPGTAGGAPEIRIRDFGKGASLTPLEDTDPVEQGKEKWTVLPENPPETNMNISQYFSRVVRDELKVPVGIVIVAVSGTNQAAWMSKETLESFPGTAPHANFYEEFFADKNKDLAKSAGAFKSWDDFQKADAAWHQDPKGAWPGRNNLVVNNFPTVLYNTRIHPLAPFSIRGVLWHQGEAGPGGPYGERLVAMFRQWRKLFGADFHVIWGTLSRSTTSQPPLSPITEGFYRSGNNVEIRKALGLFGGDPKAEYVEFYDLGNEDTHFLQKAEAGRRMALAALAKVHGKAAPYTGPRLVESKFSGRTVTLKFGHTGDGLVYKPSINGISGIYLHGPGDKARWAEVKQVDANTLECSHPDIAEVQAAVYGSNPNPHETLFNSAGLPASAFALNPNNLVFRDPKPAIQLVALEGGKSTLCVTHTRREGYVFQIKASKDGGSGPCTVKAFVPEEWKGCEVEADGKPVTTEALAQDGANFVRFQVTVGGPPAIVAQPGKAAEFRKVNRF